MLLPSASKRGTRARKKSILKFAFFPCTRSTLACARVPRLLAEELLKAPTGSVLESAQELE
eukprot:239472-Prorocentrum_minimum.AAC.1